MRIKARGSPLKISKLSCQTTKIGSKQRRSTIWNHASLRYTINETSEVRFAIYAFDYALRINLQHASAPSPCAANDNGNDHRAAAIDLQADKSCAARGSVCNVLLSRGSIQAFSVLFSIVDFKLFEGRVRVLKFFGDASARRDFRRRPHLWFPKS